MNCLNDSMLQAYIDGEGSEMDRQQVATHLKACEVCRSHFQTLKAHNEAATRAFANFYNEQAIPEPAFRAFNKRTSNLQTPTIKGAKIEMKAYKKYLATACAALVFFGGISAPPVRAAVGDAVSIFRAQDIQKVDVSLGDLKSIEESLRNREGDIKIDNLAEISQSGAEYKIISAEEAQGLVNFPLKKMTAVTGFKSGETNIVTAGTISLKLNINNVNELMKTLGATKPFETSLDGKTFSIHSPAMVTQSYNNADNSKWVRLTQTKLPEIKAPEGTSMESLIDSISSLGILPIQLQSQIRALKDTGNTLYLPNVDGSLKEVTIAGKKVFVTFDTYDGKTHGDAIWMDNGILRNLSGDFNEAELAQWIEQIQ